MALTIDNPSNLMPSTNGLLSAAPAQAMPDHGAFEGIQWTSDLCGEGHLYPGICDTTPPSKEFDVCEDGDCDLVVAAPFITYVTQVCGPGRSMAEVQRRIRRKELLRQGWLVERAFWGDDGSAPGYLQTLGETPIDSEADLVLALSQLEQHAADNFGLPALIHVRAGMASRLGAAGLLRSVTGPLVTWAGNRVVVGDGYGPVDAAGDPLAAGTDQIWATGPVSIWKSDVQVPDPRQTFDRATNQQYALAERTWVLAHECYAAVITVPGA